MSALRMVCRSGVWRAADAERTCEDETRRERTGQLSHVDLKTRSTRLARRTFEQYAPDCATVCAATLQTRRPLVLHRRPPKGARRTANEAHAGSTLGWLPFTRQRRLRARHSFVRAPRTLT